MVLGTGSDEGAVVLATGSDEGSDVVVAGSDEGSDVVVPFVFSKAILSAAAPLVSNRYGEEGSFLGD